jgi:dihydroorotase
VANLLYLPRGWWYFTKDAILSKSKNSAFLDKTIGKVYGVINQGQLILA